MMPGLPASHSWAGKPSTEASRRRDLQLHAMANLARRLTQGRFNRNETVPATLS